MNRLTLKFFLALLLFTLPCRGDGNCPDVNAVAVISGKIERTFQNFLSETLQQRLGIEYNDGQLSEKYKKSVSDAAQKYAEALAQMLDKQIKCKEQIEDYDGNDWEEKFGSTGLWNELKNDILKSRMLLSRIDDFRTSKSVPLQITGAGNFETDANLAFAQLRAGSDEQLKKTIEKWPASRDMFGKLALEKFGSVEDVSKITPTEAELACQAALENNPEDYVALLVKLTDIEKLQMPIVYNAAAVAAEKENPQKAMEFFTKAGRNKDAAVLAYKLYGQKVIDCEQTADVFEKYFKDAGDDYNMLYYYSFVLINCGREDDAEQILDTVADSNYRYASEALDLYCRILLNKSQGEKVLLRLEGKDLPILKARAYWILGQKKQTLSELARAENFSDEDADSCKLILGDIIKNIDELSETLGRDFLENCTVVSEKTGETLLALEFQIAASESNSLKNLEIEKSLTQADAGERDFLRISARFNTKIGNFKDAYNLWSKLLSMQSSGDSFFAAKYYQLLCLSKLSAQDAQKAAHGAEVLLNSSQIGEFWQKKLQNLAFQNH
jgi:hypothetical protein